MTEITVQLWLAIRLAAEIARSCHCGDWSLTPHGLTCVSPLAYPRCELIRGWHEISPGVPVCTVGAECSAKEWEP